MPASSPAASGDPGPGGAPAAPAALDALSPSSLERVADAVYRLLRDDLVRQRERRGASLGRWR